MKDTDATRVEESWKNYVKHRDYFEDKEAEKKAFMRGYSGQDIGLSQRELMNLSWMTRAAIQLSWNQGKVARIEDDGRLESRLQVI